MRGTDSNHKIPFPKCLFSSDVFVAVASLLLTLPNVYLKPLSQNREKQPGNERRLKAAPCDVLLIPVFNTWLPSEILSYQWRLDVPILYFRYVS